MSDNYWVGAGVAVAQVTSVQITGNDAATTYKITIGGTNGAPAVVISAGGQGSAALTAAALAAAWELSVHPYCAVVSAAAVASDTITFTAMVAGFPFVITSSVTGGGGTIGAATAMTASAGPYHYDTAANWSTAAAPVNSDNVFFRRLAGQTVVPVLFGLAQSGVTPALLAIEKSYAAPGRIGLYRGKFQTGANSFEPSVPEYRASYLATGAALLRIGENFDSGAGGSSGVGGLAELIKVDLGSTNAAAAVFDSGEGQDSSGVAVWLKMNHASATLRVYKGRVGLCYETPGETGQVASVEEYTGFVGVGDTATVGHFKQVAGESVHKKVPGSLTLESNATARLAQVNGGTITLADVRGRIIPGPVATLITGLKG